MTQLKVGDKAPDFSGKNQDGEVVRLDDFLGRKLILYFYPKDDTPGCTAEACNLNENYNNWLEKGFSVVGVSPDTVESHKKFREKYGIRFHLISDPEKEILKAYDSWGLKKNYGKEYMGVLRTTFVIDENGKIENIIKKVDTKDHTNQILKSLNF